MKRLYFVYCFGIMPGLQLITAQIADTILIEHVNVIPMTGQGVLVNHRVAVSAGKIIGVEPDTLDPGINNPRRIDGGGGYLIPGLSEMHYHMRGKDISNDRKLLIANGVTTVRNLAALDGQDQIGIREQLNSGKLPGPRYFTSGPYLKLENLSSEEQITSVVATHAEEGYNFLKLADNLPVKSYTHLMREAEKKNVAVVGHAQRSLPLEYSLRMKSIEHLEEFLYLKEIEGGPNIYDFTIQDLDRIAGHIRQSGVYIGTTLAVFEFITQCLDDTKFKQLRRDPNVRYLAKLERENFLTDKNDYRKLKDREFDGVKAVDLFDAYFAWIKNFARVLSDAGVPLLTGSDTYGMVIIGFSLHHEFALLQEAGLKPYEILRASTVNPARYLGTYATEGTITAGKNANLVLLKDNPLDDIRNTQSINGVMLKGDWLNREHLDQMLEEIANAYK